jgi:hypothetical protein
VSGADKPCQVAGCPNEGAWGVRRNLANWRDGYLWWCAAHRDRMPARSAPAAPLTATLDRGGQGRLL